MRNPLEGDHRHTREHAAMHTILIRDVFYRNLLSRSRLFGLHIGDSVSPSSAPPTRPSLRFLIMPFPSTSQSSSAARQGHSMTSKIQHLTLPKLVTGTGRGSRKV